MTCIPNDIDFRFKVKHPKRNHELSLWISQSQLVFLGSQFGWFGCIKTKCSWSRLDDCCQRLGRSNDFSTNINWKDFSRSCLLIKECVRQHDVTSLWRHHYVIVGLIGVTGVGERQKSIGALVIYFIDSSDPIETCKNFYSVQGSKLSPLICQPIRMQMEYFIESPFRYDTSDWHGVQHFLSFIFWIEIHCCQW